MNHRFQWVLKALSLIFAFASASTALASTDSIFYWGEYKGLTGKMSCLVKVNSADESKISLEGIVFLAHDNKYVYTDELVLNYDASKNSYVFNSTESAPLIKQAVLFLDAQNSFSRFAAAVLHHNHYDPTFCENLMEAKGEEITLAEEFFTLVVDIYSEEDHDHDHSHDHDHDHNHQHDHDDEHDHDHSDHDDHDHDHNH